LVTVYVLVSITQVTVFIAKSNFGSAGIKGDGIDLISIRLEEYGLFFVVDAPADYFAIVCTD